MSYFEDNEEYLIWGPRRRPVSDYDDPCEEDSPDGWYKEDGTFIYIVDADFGHLVNTLGLLRRSGRGSDYLALNIKEEMHKRLKRF